MEAWTPILPWLERLRGRLRVEETEAPHSARRTYAWLQLALPKRRRTTSSEQVREVREALELLAIVAAADLAAWRHLLRECCGVYVEADEAFATERSPLRVIFVLDDHTKESILWPAALCNKFFGLLTPVAHSEAFLSAKHFALDRMAGIRRGQRRHGVDNDGGVAVMPSIPFCLHFAPKRMGLASLVQYLNSVRKVVVDVREKQQTPRHGLANGKTGAETDEAITTLKSNKAEAVLDASTGADQAQPFVLSAIQLNLGDFEMNEAVSRAVEAVLATGVDVSCLQLSLTASDFLADDECPRQPLASCFQSIVASSSKTLLGDSAELQQISPELMWPAQQPQGKGVETLVVHGRDVDDRRFAALCSSLSEAQSVTDLVLEAVFTQDSLTARSIKWKWLAFAVAVNPASEHLSSSLRKLTISDALLLETDIDAMETVFRSNYPAMELIDPLWSHEDQQTLSTSKGAWSIPSTRLEKGTIIYTEPVLYREDWLHNTVVVQRDASFDVMTNDPEREWIEILVPGYGKCWVHEGVVKDAKPPSSSSLSSNQDVRGRHPRTLLTSLAVAVDVEDDSVLVRLFALMGECLEDVCLNVNTLGDQALDAILRSCPRVKRLVLRGVQLKSLDGLVRAYEEREFHLTSLTLTDFQIDTDSMLTFIEHLSDPTGAHAVATHLKELCIGHVKPTRGEDGEEDDRDAARSIMKALLAMLDANRMALEYLELHLTASLFEEFESRFEDHDNAALLQSDRQHPRLVPLRLSCRLAFLSVLKARKAGELLASHCVLRLVFDFASTPALRHIRVVECE